MIKLKYNVRTIIIKLNVKMLTIIIKLKVKIKQPNRCNKVKI